MAKKNIWYNAECSYVGATGVDSVEEMAELALAQGNEHIIDLFDFDPDVDLMLSDVVKVLNGLRVEATVIPAAHLHRERWDSGNSWTVALDAKPGRGYVKVLGIQA